MRWWAPNITTSTTWVRWLSAPPPHLIDYRNFPPPLSLSEEGQIPFKLPKICQILFWPGFSCSIPLQRVRFGVVAHVPTLEQETVSLSHDPNSWCSFCRSSGLCPALSLSCSTDVQRFWVINTLTRGKFHWVSAQSLVVTKERSSELTSRFLGNAFQGVLHTQVLF